jgi:flagellar biosynthesis chaperone FliJ
VTTLEKRVSQLEQSIAASQAALAQASSNADGAGIQRISQELATYRRELDQSISQWEAAQAELDALEKLFEQRLEKFVTA